ncbi:MAG: metalloregulator ArsR/SmtB family transcription factor [Pseudomonadota bacterium]
MERRAAVIALGALAQDTRLQVFRRLVAAGEAGVSAGDLARDLDVAPATLSFHLKELARAELVDGHQDGRFVIYKAKLDAMAELIGYLALDCCGGRPELCLPRKLDLALEA